MSSAYRVDPSADGLTVAIKYDAEDLGHVRDERQDSDFRFDMAMQVPVWIIDNLVVASKGSVYLGSYAEERVISQMEGSPLIAHVVVLFDGAELDCIYRINFSFGFFADDLRLVNLCR